MTSPSAALPDVPYPVCANAHGNAAFGTREPLRYGACGACGLLDVPADLSPYYPADYCSFGAARSPGSLRGALRALWASEQYRLDIPLNGARSYRVDPAASPFTPEQIAGFERRARDLNARSEGDTAAFYLRPTA